MWHYNNKPTLKAALGALAVLTSEQKNVGKLRSEGLNLETYANLAAKEKDERVKMFVQQLQERLYGEIA